MINSNRPPLLRVAYFSRNAMRMSREGAIAEVDRILESAQRNNALRDVTGALIFNNGAFAQVLEGPGPAVEDVFNTIQMDDRHHDITVLQSDWVEERMFPNWSMGFAGRDAIAAADYAGIAERSSFDEAAFSANDLMQLMSRLAERNELSTRTA